MLLSSPYMYLFHLLLENEVHRQYEADKGGQMVPLQFQFEGEHREYRKYGQRNDFLNHFQLHDVEGAAVVLKAQPVGRHLKAIFKEGDRPAKGDHSQ